MLKKWHEFDCLKFLKLIAKFVNFETNKCSHDE